MRKKPQGVQFMWSHCRSEQKGLKFSFYCNFIHYDKLENLHKWAILYSAAHLWSANICIPGETEIFFILLWKQMKFWVKSVILVDRNEKAIKKRVKF